MRRSGFGGSGTVHSRSFWLESEEAEVRERKFYVTLRDSRSHGSCAQALDWIVAASRGLARMDGNRVYIELSRDAAAALKQQRESEDAFGRMLGEFRQTCVCGRRRGA